MVDEEKLKKAAEIGLQAFKLADKLIHKEKENRIIKIVEELEKFIKANANLAFPVNFSVNEVAAHDTAQEKDPRMLKEGDIIKIDIGVHVDGYIADMAKTYIHGEDIYNLKEMIKANENALKEAVKHIKPGIKINEIGEIIENTAEKEGFAVIANLTGHGIGRYDIHSNYSIPNIRNSETRELEENDLIAIEPFFAEGKGRAYIKDAESVEIYAFNTKSHSTPRSVLGRKMYAEIKSKYATGLPFAKRWLTTLQGFAKKKALYDLMQQNIIEGYPVLIERNKKKVSQAEATILVKDKPLIFSPVL
ncbi:MAG: type II methionyl aminopeptidase [Candidatus Nanohaloarchaeota archaeon]|nr:type II methionyl aminopeptidase [Candidatus Nanohaloarchaeota archaeon]